MADVAEGRDPKGVWRESQPMLEVDTFHGHIHVKDLKIGAENLPSSRNGAGLIRDPDGKLVFA
jgi:hypothetical protein